MKSIPAGYAVVDVKTDAHGPCKMVAGHVAATASASPAPGLFSSSNPSSLPLCPETAKNLALYDTLSPAPQWFLYTKALEPRYQRREEKQMKEREKRMKEWRKVAGKGRT